MSKATQSRAKQPYGGEVEDRGDDDVRDCCCVHDEEGSDSEARHGTAAAWLSLVVPTDADEQADELIKRE